MEIEVVQDPDHIRQAIPVIRSAWGMENIEQLVKDMLAAMRFHGGLVMLAREDGRVVGMHFSFAGMKNGKTYLYSHMTGVVAERKYSGIGEILKLRQKEWAIRNGYDLIAWTYDPLMALNANFNIHKLGSISRTYLRDFYGEMEDALNFGIPTDRFVTEWWILRERFRAGKPECYINCTEKPIEFRNDQCADVLGLHIPEDYVDMKRKDHGRALELRLATRAKFEELFSAGYTVTDYDRKNSAYTLERKAAIDEKYGKNIFS
ncbi:MAG: GNAT family N-acetyltransferase [Thermoplasmataceae archaeon]